MAGESSAEDQVLIHVESTAEEFFDMGQKGEMIGNSLDNTDMSNPSRSPSVA